MRAVAVISQSISSAARAFVFRADLVGPTETRCPSGGCAEYPHGSQYRTPPAKALRDSLIRVGVLGSLIPELA